MRKAKTKAIICILVLRNIVTHLHIWIVGLLCIEKILKANGKHIFGYHLPSKIREILYKIYIKTDVF